MIAVLHVKQKQGLLQNGETEEEFDFTSILQIARYDVLDFQ
jgi:hypothetical protein